MKSIPREHAGAGIVALAIVTAAVFDGAFSASAFALVALLTWAAIIAGVLGRVLPSGPVGLLAVVGGAALAATMLLSGASVLWASDQGRAFEETVRVSAYLGLFVLAAFTSGAGARRQWLSGLAVGIGVTGLLAVFSYLQPQVLEPEDIGALIPNAAGRLSYPVGYWNALVALLACGSVLLADSAIRARGRPWRVLALATLPVLLLGLWLTDSRAGVGAAFAGLLVLVCASRQRARLVPALALALVAAAVLVVSAEQYNELLAGADTGTARAQGDRLGILVAAIVLICAACAWQLDGAALRLRSPSRPTKIALGVVALVLTAIAILVADPAERWDQFREPPPALVSGAGVAREANSSGRWQFWSEALAAFESEPVRGIGAGSFESWWGQHAPIPLFIRNPHSLPIQQLAELGAAGVVLMLGFVAALAVAVSRHLRHGLRPDTGVLLGVALAAGLSAAVDWSWQFPACFGPAVIAMALLMAGAPGRGLAPRRRGLAPLVTLVGLVSLAGAGAVALSELRLEQSRSAAAEGRIETAFERAREARATEPFASKPYLQLALLEELEGDYGRALAYVEEAEARDEDDWRLVAVEARLRQRVGDELGARAAVRRAIELSPRSAGPAGQAGP